MYLTVREAAALLACTERQIYRWVDDAEIPFERVRDQLRFNRTNLFEWATARRLPISLEAFDADLDPEDRSPSLAQAIRAGGVHINVPGANRDSALRAVVERTPMPPSLDRDFLVEVLVARENIVSTAIGDGIAIPHVRQPVAAPGASATVSVSHLQEPVEFNARDDCPRRRSSSIRIIFLIVSPTIRAHLQLLARVARALLDPEFRATLERRAPTEELAQAAARLEQAPPVAPPAPRDEGAD